MTQALKDAFIAHIDRPDRICDLIKDASMLATTAQLTPLRKIAAEINSAIGDLETIKRELDI
jgi:hypothetical protein